MSNDYSYEQIGLHKLYSICKLFNIFPQGPKLTLFNGGSHLFFQSTVKKIHIFSRKNQLSLLQFSTICSAFSERLLKLVLNTNQSIDFLRNFFLLTFSNRTSVKTIPSSGDHLDIFFSNFLKDQAREITTKLCSIFSHSFGEQD